MHINLHLLRIFFMVADHRSFSRAAEVLHVSQPAVSKAVRELERQLDLTLIERGSGGARGASACAIDRQRQRLVRARPRHLRVGTGGTERTSVPASATSGVAWWSVPARRLPDTGYHLTWRHCRRGSLRSTSGLWLKHAVHRADADRLRAGAWRWWKVLWTTRASWPRTGGTIRCDSSPILRPPWPAGASRHR